jgi:glyoxylase-like metal-dependent hydrolase (beta-lactamase superfamily II)
VDVVEIARGLWRWTAPHPDWTPEQGGPEGWEADVGSVYCEADGAVVLVDPVVPGATVDRERFWAALDRDLERVGAAPEVLLTCGWHARSTSAILERYDGAVAWAPAASVDELSEGIEANRFAPGDALPDSAQAFEAALPGEVVFWLPSHGALVSGDTLLGADDGGVRVCPDSWLEGFDPAEVRAGLRERLSELAVERVLVSHGEPVLEGGREALARALAG